MVNAVQKAALVAAGFSASVSGLLSMQVRYTDNFINGMHYQGLPHYPTIEHKQSTPKVLLVMIEFKFDGSSP